MHVYCVPFWHDEGRNALAAWSITRAEYDGGVWRHSVHVIIECRFGTKEVSMPWLGGQLHGPKKMVVHYVNQLHEYCE